MLWLCLDCYDCVKYTPLVNFLCEGRMTFFIVSTFASLIMKNIVETFSLVTFQQLIAYKVYLSILLKSYLQVPLNISCGRIFRKWLKFFDLAAKILSQISTHPVYFTFPFITFSGKFHSPRSLIYPVPHLFWPPSPFIRLLRLLQSKFHLVNQFISILLTP